LTQIQRISPEWKILPSVTSKTISADHFEMTTFNSLGQDGIDGLLDLLNGNLSTPTRASDVESYLKKLPQKHHEVGAGKGDLINPEKTGKNGGKIPSNNNMVAEKVITDSYHCRTPSTEQN
jgi:hypothetical protein